MARGENSDGPSLLRLRGCVAHPCCDRRGRGSSAACGEIWCRDRRITDTFLPFDGPWSDQHSLALAEPCRVAASACLRRSRIDKVLESPRRSARGLLERPYRRPDDFFRLYLPLIYPRLRSRI